MEFRAASPADPDAHELIVEYFAERAAGFPGEYRPTFPAADAFTPPDGVLLLVEHDERGLIGCGAIRRIADGPHGARFEIKHVFMRPAARGLGAGRLLLEELERRARAWDARELVLDTHHTLEAAAALYARTGFTAIDPYNDNPNATRWYGKPLA
ncbi:GNAT family N-acetyltransferase [Microbacterium sp. MEC084]|jgi:GNAT superfamily N-acetyltransferase|uniref:GNAT family N-acetyltransferase n=1 Tax=Microbacterium sp. MEC084 TaxID=1963027 RepID=UPI00106F3D61|nr:GNAT family N-acetyltransferase [Microbacterium sp. MEC084]MCD1268271.1 GNAT family N-acetyltransferase [Microbacterium sp. MEC084]